MDPLSDMIIKIKNAGAAHKESVVVTHSKMKYSVVEALVKSGFVASAAKKGKKTVKYIDITLAYEMDASGHMQPKIAEVKRLSKSSKRVYMQAKDIRPVRSGYGVMILSTPKGIMTGSEARKAGVGGEALFTAW